MRDGADDFVQQIEDGDLAAAEETFRGVVGLLRTSRLEARVIGELWAPTRAEELVTSQTSSRKVQRELDAYKDYRGPDSSLRLWAEEAQLSAGSFVGQVEANDFDEAWQTFNLLAGQLHDCWLEAQLAGESWLQAAA